ncbi:MAG TPA: DUF6600 domain-containing protein [Mucilaginibacter sp.]
MKYINKISGISLIAFLIMLAAPNISKAQGGYVSDQEFYDELEPYGTWVDDPQYGTVWVPDAEDGFRPYATRGHWVVTDYGNTWVSDYEWGWAPFHYGRWRYDDYYGWEWIPGHEWAPAWVSWRHGGGYYGWAPLTPGISINISIGGGYHVPDYYWTCAPQAYITSPNIYNYYVPHTRVVNIIHNTTVINNTYVYNNRTYLAGPRINEIRQVTRNNNIPVYRVNNATRPNGGGRVVNNTVNIYRPEVRKAPDARPARVVNGAEYRRDNPNQGIASRANGQATINRNNAARLAEVAKSNDARLVKINEQRQRDQQNQSRQQQMQERQQQQEVQRQQRDQQQNQARQQQVQERQQQQEVQRQQRDQRQNQARQQQVQERQQQQEVQRQQRDQQQNQARQQQMQERQQQQEVQRQQQMQQRQQQQEAQRQQQMQQQQAQREQQQRQQQERQRRP